MANPLFEEFTLPLAGRPLVFRWGMRELIAMQEALADGGEAPSLQAIDREISAGRLRYRRAMLWAGMRAHQPEITEDAVTDLMVEATKAELNAVYAGFGFSIRPDPEDVAALGLDAPAANPPTAQAPTTGEPSIGTPAAVV